MAIRSGFFNSVNGDRKYDARRFAEYFASFIGNGVFPNPSTNLQVVAQTIPDMTVIVRPGKAWINGYILINDDNYVLQLDPADGVLNRIDRVVVRHDVKDREIRIEVKKGTFSSTPAPPALQRDADAYELGLADIYVRAGAVNIIQDNITDLRGNKELCGRVDSLIAGDVSTLAALLDAHLNDKNNPHNVTPEQIGAETPAGAQAKAEAAAGAVQAELDAHLSAIATQEQLGHVKAGQNITIDSDGTMEVVIDVGDIPGLVSSRLALGNSASATGTDSVALGWGASAAGSYSVALGRFASAAGSYSVALGRDASATRAYSVALGYDASAENNNEGILGGTGSSRTSKWKVPGDFTVSGTKNFEIPHPKPEKSATHVIRHGAVESPTPGDTLYRWRVQASKDNDLVTIDLPDYFVWLNTNVQIFVTPQGHFGNGYGVLNRETEQLEIHCQFAGEYNVLVIGTRNDDHPSVQEWYIKGVEREIGESWTGETYAFSVDEIIEIEEIKEVSA